jgi:predicted benzoate:H+ symporter BenE
MQSTTVPIEPTSTALDAPLGAAALAPDAGDSLPALVVGERPEIRREHRWPGKWFYGLSYVMSVCLGVGAVGFAMGSVVNLQPVMAGFALLLGLGSAVQWRLATEVQHFSRWGWYGVMVELSVASAANVWAMEGGDSIVGVAINLLWMRYFWKRRDQFDIDLGG